MLDIWNVITLLLVIVTLVLFRRLDRGNRSIEKVKRYADRVMGQLGEFVDEKASRIRDLAIEIQVNTKTGQELLKRVRGIQESIEGKINQTDLIEKRLNGFDSALKELADMAGRVDQNLNRVRTESEVVSKIEVHLKKAKEQLDLMAGEYPRLQAKLHQQDRAQLEIMHDEVIVKAEKSDRVISENFERIQGIASALETRVEELESEREVIERKSLENTKQKLSEMVKATEIRLVEITNESEKIINNGSEELTKAASNAKNFSDEAFSKIAAEVKLNGESTDEQIKDIHQSLNAKYKSLDNLSDQIEKSKDAIEINLQKKVTILSEDIEVRFSNVENQSLIGIDNLSSDLESRMLDKVEARLEEIEGHVEVRISKFEQLQSDFIDFEKSFNKIVNKKGEWLHNEMAIMSQNLLDEHSGELDVIRSRFDETKEGLKSMEESVSLLKATAYEEVSNRLQTFHENFESDLQERTRNMENSLTIWQEEINSNVKQFTEKNHDEQERISLEAKSMIHEKIEKIRKRTSSEIERIDIAFSVFEAGIQERLRSVDEIIAEQHAHVTEELSLARSSGEDVFKRGMEQTQRDIDQKVQIYKRQLTEDIEKMDQGSRSQLQMLEETISSFSLEFNEKIYNIKEDYTKENKILTEMWSKDQTRIRLESQGLSDSIEKLKNNLESVSSKARENFVERINAQEIELREYVTRILTEIDTQSESARGVVENQRMRAEQNLSELANQIDSDSRTILSKVAEVDRKVNSFIDQTSLFERADSLATNLDNKIHDMEERISIVVLQRDELQIIQNEIIRTRKIGEEVSGKLTRFHSERRRIQSMEANFSKLVVVAKDIDNKLNSIEAQRDSLQDIQIQIRGLQELEETVETNFERLEKQRTVLDNTVDGVDRNFERLHDIEQTLSNLEPDIEGVTNRVGELQERVDVLGKGRDRADKAVAVLQQIDQTMSELENRSERLQEAREWLARTETRLEDVGNQAQEQVELLQTLVKSERDSGSGEKGMINKRETVAKLSHQGWTVSEIAKVTKLSRGEVELYLEVSPSKAD